MSRRVDRLFSPLFLLVASAIVANGSVHEYKGERFASKGNAFFVHGGSEGIYYSSSSSDLNDSAIPSNGESFIK